MDDFNHRHVLATLPIRALQGPPSMQRDRVSDSSRTRLVDISCFCAAQSRARQSGAGWSAPAAATPKKTRRRRRRRRTPRSASATAMAAAAAEAAAADPKAGLLTMYYQVSRGPLMPQSQPPGSAKQLAFSSIQSLTPRHRVLQHDSTLQLQSLLPRPAQFVHTTTCSEATPSDARATAVGSSLEMHSCRSFNAFHARCHNR